MYKLHTNCRACALGAGPSATLKQSTAAGDLYAQNGKLVPVMDLGLQPPANDFVPLEAEHAGFAPLKVLLCPRCKLAQLSVIVDPNLLYRNYCYVTSRSETMKAHFNQLIVDIQKECGVGSVLEIGSNDGTLLAEFAESGFSPRLGIDPAENLCRQANQIGIATLCVFFDEHSALQAARMLTNEPSVIVARHVFCHCADWRGFIRAVELITSQNTAIFIEVPWVMDQLNAGSFDQIYFEHLSYLNVGAIVRLLTATNLHVHAIKHYAIHGGAIVLTLRSNACGKPLDPSVEQFIDAEKDLTVERWRKSAQESEVRIMELSAFVRNAVSEGKTVVGYGASAKSTVWITACGFTKKEVKFICDETPGKWNKVSPGSDIPIVDSGALTRELPDYAICFAWNFFQEIYDKEKIFRSKGGRWIKPIPKLEVV